MQRKYELARMNMLIIHISGNINAVSDALSRYGAGQYIAIKCFLGYLSYSTSKR